MKNGIVVVLFCLSSNCFAQTVSPRYFIDQLKDNSEQQSLTRAALYDSLNKKDTASLLQLFAEMEKATADASKKMKARVLALKSRSLFYQLGPGDSLYAAQMKQALNIANELDEPYMIAEYSRWYGEMLNSLHKKEAIQYVLNAIVLQEQLGLKNFNTVNTFYFTIGELILRNHNFEDAVTWLNKGLALPGADSVLPANYANALNNLALAYYYLKDYNKSLEHYIRCMNYCSQHQLEQWYTIAYFNRISAYVELNNYDSSKKLLDELYKIGLEQKSDYMLAGICYHYGQLANKQKDYARALDWLTKADMYANKTGINSNRIQICKELSVCYNGLKQFDKSLLYLQEYQHLDDSIKKAVEKEKTDFLLAKANFEKTQLDLRTLRNKKAADIRIRNAGIAALVLLSGIVIWWLNRKRKKAGSEKTEAEKQLRLFTSSIIEKDQRIEALQQELQAQSSNMDNAAKVEELSQQLILTNDDWQRFQSLFEKAWPGFILRLKEKAPGITEAEIRMACLIRIRLTTKQVASMQGISTDSVHKTRQRLRQRFDTASTAELEALILAV